MSQKINLLKKNFSLENPPSKALKALLMPIFGISIVDNLELLFKKTIRQLQRFPRQLVRKINFFSVALETIEKKGAV
jgi:hypothetical protein